MIFYQFLNFDVLLISKSSITSFSVKFQKHFKLSKIINTIQTVDLIYFC